MTGRRRLAAAAVVLVIAAGAGGAAWYWLSLPRPEPVERGWTATVGVLAPDAALRDPFGLVLSGAGTIYVTESGGAPRVSAVEPDGRRRTIAGGPPGLADGAGGAARFETPSALAFDAAGALVVADTGNNAIRRVSLDGTVTTIAGGNGAGYLDGPARLARFNGPVGLAVALDGRIIVADTYNDRVRAITPAGEVVTLAGGEPGLADGDGASARFHTPSGIAIDREGAILVADTGNGLVRRIGGDGRVSTIATSGGLWRPVGLAAGLAGEIVVADESGRIVEIHADGVARIVAGAGSGFANGSGADARFRRPSGVAISAPGRLVVVDAGNALLRLVVATARRELRLPAPPDLAPRFDAARFRLAPLLWPVAPMHGPHEIAGTMGEARGEEAERFHSGVDVRIEQGTAVHAVRDGLVTSPVSAHDFGTLNESIRVGDVAYVHVRAGRDRQNRPFDPARFAATVDERGAATSIRVKRGARFATGDVIATVNAFNHVHMNVGWPGEEHNPLLMRLAQFEDAIAPTVPANGVRVTDPAGVPFAARPRRRPQVSGPVRIVVDAWDQADGNRPNRRLGLLALGYQILGSDRRPAPGFEAPRETIRFDRAASTPGAARLVYAPGSGIPFYGRRVTRFLYTVTNTFRGGIASEGFWDTSRLAPGDYTIVVWGEDAGGNRTTRELPVTVVESSATSTTTAAPLSGRPVLRALPPPGGDGREAPPATAARRPRGR